MGCTQRKKNKKPVIFLNLPNFFKYKFSVLKAALLAIGFALLAALIIYSDAAQLIGYLLKLRASTVVVLFALSALSILLWALRLKFLLAVVGKKVSMWELFPAHAYGIALSNLVPGRFSVAIRPALLRVAGIPFVHAFLCVVVERVVDILIYLIFSPPAVASLDIPVAPFVVLAAGAGAALAFLVLPAVPRRALCVPWVVAALRTRVPVLRNSKLLTAFAQFGSALRPAIAIALVLGLAILGLNTLIFLVLADEFGFQLNPIAAAAALALSTVVGLVTFIPGGLGATEVTLATILVAQGVPLPTATASAIVARALTLWLTIAIGFVAGFALKK